MHLAVVGTGYVGLVTAACFAEMGNDVCCIDINPEIIENLRQGRIHIHEPGLEPMVKRNAEEGRLSFTTDLAEGIATALFIFNCGGDTAQAGRLLRPVLCPHGRGKPSAPCWTSTRSSSINPPCPWEPPKNSRPLFSANWTSAASASSLTSSPTLNSSKRATRSTTS